MRVPLQADSCVGKCCRPNVTPFAPARHCPIAHLQNFSVATGLGSASNYHRHGTAPNNPLKRIHITGVYCFYNVCAGFSTHSCSMCDDLRVMRVFNVLSRGYIIATRGRLHSSHLSDIIPSFCSISGSSFEPILI